MSLCGCALLVYLFRCVCVLYVVCSVVIYFWFGFFMLLLACVVCSLVISSGRYLFRFVICFVSSLLMYVVIDVCRSFFVINFAPPFVLPFVRSFALHVCMSVCYLFIVC